MHEPGMHPRLEGLYLQAVRTGWPGDWSRYYAADEAIRDAQLAQLDRYSHGTGPQPHSYIPRDAGVSGREISEGE